LIRTLSGEFITKEKNTMSLFDDDDD